MQVPGTGLVIYQPIYDTINLAIGATSGTFFQVPLGSILVGTTPKNYQHTNMVQAGRLDTGYSFEIDGLAVWFPETATRSTQVDIRAVQSGFLQLSIQDTQIFTVPLCICFMYPGLSLVLPLG